MKMPKSTSCADACGIMYNDARLDANSLRMGKIVDECVAPQIHPDIPTDSPSFGISKMTIIFINNFLTICPTRLRFSVLLDHNSTYIAHKR